MGRGWKPIARITIDQADAKSATLGLEPRGWKRLFKGRRARAWGVPGLSSQVWDLWVDDEVSRHLQAGDATRIVAIAGTYMGRHEMYACGRRAEGDFGVARPQVRLVWYNEPMPLPPTGELSVLPPSTCDPGEAPELRVALWQGELFIGEKLWEHTHLVGQPVYGHGPGATPTQRGASPITLAATAP